MPDPSVLGPVAAFVFLVMGLVVKVLWDLHKAADVELRKERDQWRSVALRLLGTNDKAITVADALTKIGEPVDGA